MNARRENDRSRQQSEELPRLSDRAAGEQRREVREAASRIRRSISRQDVCGRFGASMRPELESAALCVSEASNRTNHGTSADAQFS